MTTPRGSSSSGAGGHWVVHIVLPGGKAEDVRVADRPAGDALAAILRQLGDAASVYQG